MYRNRLDDFNAVPNVGIYHVDSKTANFPEGAFKWGICLYCGSPTFAIQIYFPNGGKNAKDKAYSFFTRTFYSDSGWRPWNEFRVFDYQL